ncbi:MAG: DNA polymerase III subunit delta, partial [Desulfobacteraceae bacterium]|nr:DNA polymerase III subunit delta [Desulfobacteraceae bacterium]
MTQIKHTQIETFLAAPKEALSNIILIYGEDYLCKKAKETLTRFILKDANKNFCQETLDAAAVSMGEIIEQTMTFSFLESKKVVAIKNAPLFSSTPGNSYSKIEIEALLQLVKKGIPKSHYLMMVTPVTDKRKALFKAIDAHGIIVDCSVAKGSRKADLEAQKNVIRQVGQTRLSESGKQLNENAFLRLLDLTGFNLSVFSQNIDKLIAYSGKNQVISIKDVNAIIQRNKKDPIYNLTNSLMERDSKNALFFTNSLFKEGFHPLQILKAIENQVRKLILVKCFVKEVRAKKTPGLNLLKLNFNS